MSSNKERSYGPSIYYPDPISIEEFTEKISGPYTIKAFIDNFNTLAEKNPEKYGGEHYAEEWAEWFIRWMEMV